MSHLLTQWNGRKIVIGMIHLGALPGSPRYGGGREGILAGALGDAEALAQGGVDGLMMENFGDVPFFPGRAPADVVAAMTALACEVRRRVELPLGINVLRNDGVAALAVAAASGAEFIRVNVLCGARVGDQGLLQGIAHELLRKRAELRCEQIRILADVDVKHSAPLALRPLGEEIEDTLHRGLADAIVVSGAGTGKVTELEKVRQARVAAGEAPLLIGSGITAESVADYAALADGFIVGSALKRDGVAGNAVDRARVEELMRSVKGLHPFSTLSTSNR